MVHKLFRHLYLAASGGLWRYLTVSGGIDIRFVTDLLLNMLRVVILQWVKRRSRLETVMEGLWVPSGIPLGLSSTAVWLLGVLCKCCDTAMLRINAD